MITHHRPSPRKRAASTYSITVRLVPKARDKRNTRVESNTAMVRISTGMLEPNTPKIIRANMSPGMDNITSTRRVKKISTQPPTTALTKPVRMPIRNDRDVMASATPIVIRVPYIMRVSMSRPIWSAPNHSFMEGSSHVPPTLADCGKGASQGVKMAIKIKMPTTVKPKAAESVSLCPKSFMMGAS